MKRIFKQFKFFWGINKNIWSAYTLIFYVEKNIPVFYTPLR
jgi:hypothetical protein